METVSARALDRDASSAAGAYTHRTLYTSVLPFYTHLIEGFSRAEERISMVYHAFVHGEWSSRISDVLIARAKTGVRVRLMTDGFGIVLEAKRRWRKNLRLIRRLREEGIRVDVFNPSRRRLSISSRLHIKLSAIDDDVAFIGGSNIADHYLTWDDTNVRLHGKLAVSLHQVYDEVLSFSSTGPGDRNDPQLDRSLDPVVKLTIPRQRKDIRSSLLKLIDDADRSIFIRTWCFFPELQVMESLIRKAQQGVDVNLMISHRSRIRPVDFANPVLCRRIVRAGGKVYRFPGKYMHSKAAWNDKGDVLLGSANLEYVGLNTNFECCVALRDPWLCARLQARFLDDARNCLRPHGQTE